MYEINTVRVNGIEMDYCCFGKGRRVFVILPGLSVKSVMLSAAAVTDAYKMFAEEFTVYLFDRRKNIPDRYGIEQMADDTAQAMIYLNLNNVCMFGASQGGMIAQVIAIKHPELVGKLVLGSSASRIDSDRGSMLADWIRLAERKDCEKLNLAFAEAIYSDDVAKAYRNYFVEDSATITEKDLQRFIIIAEGTEGFDVTDQLNRISCPIMLLGSQDDKVLGPQASDEIIDALKAKKDFEYYIYDGYGHASFDTAPDYKDRLMTFFMKEY